MKLLWKSHGNTFLIFCVNVPCVSMPRSQANSGAYFKSGRVWMHRLLSFITILFFLSNVTVKILKIGTPEIITIIVLQLEQLDFTVQYCVRKMQTE